MWLMLHEENVHAITYCSYSPLCSILSLLYLCWLDGFFPLRLNGRISCICFGLFILWFWYIFSPCTCVAFLIRKQTKNKKKKKNKSQITTTKTFHHSFSVYRPFHCMFVFILHVCSAHRSQKRTFDLMWLRFYSGVNYHLGAGTWNWVF